MQFLMEVTNGKLDLVEDALRDISLGKMVIVTDDESREMREI